MRRRPQARRATQADACVHEDPLTGMRTLVSLPFRPGPEGRVQVKVIDARGNAVVKTARVA